MSPLVGKHQREDKRAKAKPKRPNNPVVHETPNLVGAMIFSIEATALAEDVPMGLGTNPNDNPRPPPLRVGILQ